MTLHHPALDLLARATLVTFRGSVLGIGQSSIDASGPQCSVGDYCGIGTEAGDEILAEVVAVSAGGVRLLPLAAPAGIRLGAPVRLLHDVSRPRGGDGFAGRAVDAFGRPIDGGPPITDGFGSSRDTPRGKLDRVIVPERVATGIRAIDGLVPLAKGQRIGIFAASGVGKTSLVEQLSRSIACDHCVLCLIGERGREVNRLWRMHTEGDDAGKVTMIAATSDESASARIRALDQALAIAEHWRAQGKHVALFVDSVTRLAMALREVGLAAGEPPTLRAYTPNVFSAMPHYVERCGGDRRGGAITAIFTVLAETDDVDDPVVELFKSLVDGHLVLSRKLAERSHFPAIDIGASVSRVADQILGSGALAAAQAIRKSFAEFEDARPMIESGIYRAGTNREIDHAIELQPRLAAFLAQRADEATSLIEVDRAMAKLAGAPR